MAYDLLHEGVQALSVVESSGMRVDMEYLDRAIRHLSRKIDRGEKELENSEVVIQWRKMFGRKTNIGSCAQLGKVLFEGLGFEATKRTPTGVYSTKESDLEVVDHPFVKQYFEVKRLKKALSTNLKGLKSEVIEGFVHPSFHLHTVQTYRSSSESPNFQNIPVRHTEIGKMVRRAFIPRDGRRIVEVDYSGIEVRIAACYHRDPSMISYIEDPTKDLHRDMAMECFMLSRGELGDSSVDPGKSVRYCGKNMFVFPQFYGDWFMDCARSLWQAIGKMNLRTASGLPMEEHLKRRGINGLGSLDPRAPILDGSFISHLKAVERRFWEERFPVYNDWKEKWFKEYKKRGWVKTLTGFICQGPMERNQVINYPVQGAAFHCLLKSLIRLVLREIPRRGMKALVVGQIHDSVVSDVPVEEIDDFVSLCREVMVTWLRRRWSWIIVPLEIDVEVTPEGGSWADKKKRKVV